jgi:hypothetical protein
VIEVTKLILSLVVLALGLASSAAASSPVRGIVVGTGNGIVTVAARAAR